MNSISLESMSVPRSSSVSRVVMSILLLGCVTTPAPGSGSVKSSFRSPTSRLSSLLVTVLGRTLSRKEVRSGRLALSRSQVKGCSCFPLLLYRGLGGLVMDLCWSGVRGYC